GGRLEVPSIMNSFFLQQLPVDVCEGWRRLIQARPMPSCTMSSRPHVPSRKSSHGGGAAQTRAQAGGTAAFPWGGGDTREELRHGAARAGQPPMKRHLWIVLGIVLLLGYGAVSLDPTYVLLGRLKNERFYKDRPTSYWSMEIQYAEQVK